MMTNILHKILFLHFLNQHQACVLRGCECFDVVEIGILCCKQKLVYYVLAGQEEIHALKI